MTSLADRTIAALRQVHDELAALVPTLTLAQLNGPSGASEWTVAQVLSHLGSGAEIALASWQPALVGAAPPADDFNQGVWDRWNAKDPQSQANDFLVSDRQFVETLEALAPDQRGSIEIKLAFLPAPLPLAGAAGMRLNETALHSWDVRVGLNPEAALDDDVAGVLVDQFVEAIGFLAGFFGKADALTGTAVIDVFGFGLIIDEAVSFTPTVEGATATFAGPREAFIRLLGGRLQPSTTPAGVTVDGVVSLDDLRLVFPGF